MTLKNARTNTRAVKKFTKRRKRKRETFSEDEMIFATIGALFIGLMGRGVGRKKQCPSKELLAPNTIEAQAVDVTASDKCEPITRPQGSSESLASDGGDNGR